MKREAVGLSFLRVGTSCQAVFFSAVYMKRKTK